MLKKLGLNLSKKEIESIVNMEPDSIEKVLLALRYHIETYMANRRSQRQFADSGNVAGGPPMSRSAGRAPQSVATSSVASGSRPNQQQQQHPGSGY